MDDCETDDGFWIKCKHFLWNELFYLLDADKQVHQSSLDHVVSCDVLLEDLDDLFQTVCLYYVVVVVFIFSFDDGLDELYSDWEEIKISNLNFMRNSFFSVDFNLRSPFFQLFFLCLKCFFRVHLWHLAWCGPAFFNVFPYQLMLS